MRKMTRWLNTIVINNNNRTSSKYYVRTKSSRKNDDCTQVLSLSFVLDTFLKIIRLDWIDDKIIILQCLWTFR